MTSKNTRSTMWRIRRYRILLWLGVTGCLLLATTCDIAPPSPPTPPATERPVATEPQPILQTSPSPWDVSWVPEDSQAVASRIDSILDGSGLSGHGGTILQYAQEYGVNPAFALAMFRKEAEFAKQGSIAQRQSNPGNIICGGGTTPLYGATGCGGRFGVYDAMADGIRAYFWLLDNEYKPGRKYDCEDIPCIITVYCPPSDCETARYVEQVVDWTIDYQTLLSKEGTLVLEPGPTLPSVAVTVVPATVIPRSLTPQAGEGRIAFLSDRDHQDVEAVNRRRPLELYTMNPDGSDQTRLTFGETPLFAVGAGANYPLVKRLLWHPAEDLIMVLLSAPPDTAAFFRPSDGQLDHTLDFSPCGDGQAPLAVSVDWSPDGKRVACELNESLWVANSDGSERRRIVENVSSHRPVWSPDGEWIAFSSGIPYETSGLYVVRPDGTQLRHVTQGHRIGWTAWSPDGAQIAYEYYDPYDIVIVAVATGRGTNLTGPLYVTASHPTWSPDGGQIAFQVSGSVDEIWIMETDGSDAHKIADGCFPAWQSDRLLETRTGSDVPLLEPAIATPPSTYLGGPGRIAFMSWREGNREIHVMNANGTGVTRLTNNPAYDGNPAWAPDGTRVAFVSERDGNFEIYAMNASGSGVIRLTRNRAEEWAPDWSPDGTHIAFVSERDGNGEVYVMNADGSGLIRLTNNPAYDGNPAWSPDGNRIAFASERDGNYEIYVMNADGSGLIRLTNNPAYDWYPAWSPDGTRIAFQCNRDGNSEIYLMSVDGSGVTRLTTSPRYDGEPSWSPDGTRIAFYSSRDGDEEIYVMYADGTGQLNLTNNPDWDGAPSWSPG